MDTLNIEICVTFMAFAFALDHNYIEIIVFSIPLSEFSIMTPLINNTQKIDCSYTFVMLMHFES